MDLIERMRRGRQTRVEHEGKVFICLRPTDWQVAVLTAAGDVKQMDLIEKFVIGWEGFTELDLFPGGGATVVEFDPALFSEWAQDRPELWGILSLAITGEYQAHKQRQEESAKK